MKQFLLFSIAVVIFLSCNNSKKEISDVTETKVMLRADTINIVKLSDTLIIYENTCRGCAYEESTHFGIKDSLDIIKLVNVITKDNNPQDMDGGSISKSLILAPLKTGSTSIKLYKFWKRDVEPEDSARFTTYKIEVHN